MRLLFNLFFYGDIALLSFALFFSSLKAIRMNMNCMNLRQCMYVWGLLKEAAAQRLEVIYEKWNNQYMLVL